MRIHQIVEADLPDIDLSQLPDLDTPRPGASSLISKVDDDTGIKVRRNRNRTFTLEYPSGKKTQVKNVNAVDKAIKAEKRRLDTLQKDTNKAIDNDEKKQAKDARDSARKSKSKSQVKGKLVAFLKRIPKSTWAGFIAALAVKVLEGGWDVTPEYAATLYRGNLDRDSEAMDQARWDAANSMAETALGMLPALAISLALTLAAIPGYGWLVLVAGATAGYFVVEYFRENPKGRQMVADVFYDLLYEFESSMDLGEAEYVFEKISEPPKSVTKDIAVDVIKSADPKIKQEIIAAIKKAKQEAS